MAATFTVHQVLQLRFHAQSLLVSLLVLLKIANADESHLFYISFFFSISFSIAWECLKIAYKENRHAFISFSCLGVEHIHVIPAGKSRLVRNSASLMAFSAPSVKWRNWTFLVDWRNVAVMIPIQPLIAHWSLDYRLIRCLNSLWLIRNLGLIFQWFMVLLRYKWLSISVIAF